MTHAVLDDDVLAALAGDLLPIEPHRERRDAIRERITSRTASRTLMGMVTVRTTRAAFCLSGRRSKRLVRPSAKQGVELDTESAEALFATIAKDIQPIEPAADRREPLRDRILKATRADAPGLVTIKPGEGDWQPVFSGVEMKFLHDHGDAQSFLVRLAAGASIAPHTHGGDELCVVLEGTVRLGDVEAGPGTYHLALVGSSHRMITTATGCTLFLRANLDHGMRF